MNQYNKFPFSYPFAHYTTPLLNEIGGKKIVAERRYGDRHKNGFNISPVYYKTIVFVDVYGYLSRCDLVTSTKKGTQSNGCLPKTV